MQIPYLAGVLPSGTRRVDSQSISLYALFADTK